MRDLTPLKPRDPQRLGEFALEGRLEDALGPGSVYLGRSRTGEPVSVRVLPPEVDPATIRIIRELQKVRYSGIAPVIGTGVDDGVGYLVSPHVHGRTLHDVVTEDGPLAEAELEWLAFGIAAGLKTIHVAGVVHRALSPHTVRLSFDGPVVTDLSLADLRRAAATAASTGSISQLGGSEIGFVAPEQLQGEMARSPADVFAWGAIVAFAAGGRAPFGQTPLTAVIPRILKAEPDLRDVPEPLRGLVREALDKDPARRPTAGQLLQRLLPRVQQGVLQTHGKDSAPLPSTSVPSRTDQRRAFHRRAASGPVLLIVSSVTVLATAALWAGGPYPQSAAVWLAIIVAAWTGWWLSRPSWTGRSAARRGRGLLDRGRPGAARQLLRQAVEFSTGRRRLIAQANLALAHRECGDLAEAHRLLSAVLPQLTEELGDGHPEVLTARADLAAVLRDLGRADEAEAQLRQIADDTASTLGDDHPQTLRARANLAVALRDAGDPAAALELLRDLLPGLTKALGNGHRDVLAIRANTAAIEAELAEPGRAAQTLDRILHRQRRTLGRDHPDTLRTSANLAQVLVRIGRTAEAVTLFDEVAERAKRTLGPDHPLERRAREAGR